MKTLKKTLIALATASLMLLASCDGDTNVTVNISSLYSEYVQNGGSLNYDEWYSTVKGETNTGKNGTSLLTGKGAPASTLGQDGDSYLDLDTFDYYTKASGAWSKVANIKGNETETKEESELSNGNGAPAAELGQDGDSYLDLDTFDFYVKVSGTWTKVGNIKGEDANKNIADITKTSGDGVNETYTITFADGSQTTFTVESDEKVEEGTDGLSYYPLEDGSYGVKMGKTKYLSEIIVPKEHNEKKVTKVLSDAFFGSGNENLKKIVLPETITEIGDQAFYGCYNLSSVTISGSAKITSIGKCAFYGCSSLTGISIPYGVETIGRFAFTGCASIEKVAIPATVYNIGSFAFLGCSKLDEIEYAGSEEMWNEIISTSLWTVPSSTTIKFGVK